MRTAFLIFGCAVGMLFDGPARADWIRGKAYKLPSEYTNQESGYFYIIEGKNGRIYIGAAKYGINGYLLEFDPTTGTTRMVLDVMKTIGSTARGFAAQAKIHTRNNVGASGRIYVGTKQGYPEKGESRDLYPGGYVMTFDPANNRCEHFGIAKPKHGIISVMPDEAHGLVYVSTCSDDRPIDHSHFMVLDLKTRKYTDLGDTEIAYAFIILDQKRRAYHPVAGGTLFRYDPETARVEQMLMRIDKQVPPYSLRRNSAILNWDATQDGRWLYSVEMTTNQLFQFDLASTGPILEGRSCGPLLKKARATDCRALCVGHRGTVWAAVTEQGLPTGPLLHLVSYQAEIMQPMDHGAIAIANPDFATMTLPDGKPKPWHHTIRREKDGTLTPWQPMGVCQASNGTVYVLTIAPFTLIRFDQFKY